MLTKNSNKAKKTVARLLCALMAFVMLYSAAAPSFTAAAPSMGVITDAQRYAGLTAEEIASVESGMTIKIRNLSAAEADRYILRFGNGNALRADGALATVGDANWPTMEKTLDANGYPAISYDRGRELDAAGLAAAYGSNTLKELFEGVDKNGNQIYTSAANALYTAENNMFKYNPETGYYTYDSKDNHTYFDINTRKFTLYDAPLRPGAITASYGYQSFGAFLPFNNAATDVVKITDANGNLVSDVTFSATASADKTIQFDTASADNADPYANLHAIYNDSTTNLADNGFIMSVDFTFFIPKDGQYNGEDMIFHFSGDDDVWVYLDGVLVVDQGGTHRHTASNINFATGEVEYQHYHEAGETQPSATEDKKNHDAWPWPWTTTTIKDAFDAAGVSYSADEFDGDTFADYTEHTFKFIFLERGGEASNCELGFNLPVLPDGALAVQKSVSGYLTENAAQAEFTFVLKDENGSAIADAAYSVMHTDGTLSSGNKTGTDGSFKLKANERAVFEDIEPNKDYSVVELTELSDSTYSTYADSTGITVDGTAVTSSTDADGNATTGTFNIYYDDSCEVNFTNNLKTVDFTVEKNTGDYISDTEEFDFTVTVEGKADESFTLSNGETKTISVPVGAEVSVTENNLPSGYSVSNKLSTADSYTDSASYSVDALCASQTVQYLNVLQTNELTVTKNITGSLGDKAKEFTFTASVTAANGETVSFPESSEYTYDASTGNVTFTLSDSESVTLAGIPYGASVAVDENADGYVAVVTDGSASSETTSYSKTSMTADVAVTYTNSLDGAPDTGIFLDSLPYIIILAMTFAGAAAYIINKRRLADFE